MLNKYGRMRLKFLKENKKAEYSIMFMDGTLNKHIKGIQNMTEELKQNNQIEWVKSMNNIKNRAEGIIYNEIIYS